MGLVSQSIVRLTAFNLRHTARPPAERPVTPSASSLRLRSGPVVMRSRRYFTLDETFLVLLVILCALLGYFDQIRYVHWPARMLLIGLIGTLLCTCFARTWMRHRHYDEYARLNGATMIAPLNRPENRRMLGFIWTMGFLKCGDWKLNCLMLAALAFQVIGYIGIALAFFRR